MKSAIICQKLPPVRHVILDYFLVIILRLLLLAVPYRKILYTRGNIMA